MKFIQQPLKSVTQQEGERDEELRNPNNMQGTGEGRGHSSGDWKEMDGRGISADGDEQPAMPGGVWQALDE